MIPRMKIVRVLLIGMMVAFPAVSQADEPSLPQQSRRLAIFVLTTHIWLAPAVCRAGIVITEFGASGETKIGRAHV